MLFPLWLLLNVCFLPACSNIPNRSTFSCPFCGARNLDQQELVKHCMENHRNDPNKVVSLLCYTLNYGHCRSLNYGHFRSLNYGHCRSRNYGLCPSLNFLKHLCADMKCYTTLMSLQKILLHSGLVYW